MLEKTLVDLEGDWKLYREDEKHKETKRFFILLVFNFLLVLSIAIMIAQSKILMTTNI